MKCSNIEMRLSEYVDGELTIKESLQLRMHLMRCAGCQRKLHVLLAFNAKAIAAFELDIDSPDLSARILAELPDRPLQARRRNANWLPKTAYALGSLAIVTAAFFTFSPFGNQDNQPTCAMPKTAQPSPVKVETRILPVTAISPGGAAKKALPMQNSDGHVAVAGKSTFEPSKLTKKQAAKPISSMEVTISAQSRHRDGSAESESSVATVFIMGKAMHFNAKNSIIEKQLPEDKECQNVQREQLVPLVTADRLAERIGAKM